MAGKSSLLEKSGPVSGGGVVGTIQAAGVGLTLTAADTVVFIDKTYTPALQVQAEDRLHRIGQKDNVTVISLLAKDTIDQGLEELLANKSATIRSIVERSTHA